MTPTTTTTTTTTLGPGKRARRLRAELQLLAASGASGAPVPLQRLTQELSVSVATVRRDLADLEAQGLVVRTHGGARISSSAVGTPRPPAGREFRGGETPHRPPAATFLPEGPFAVAIGGGTTAAEVARALVFRTELTILTNSLTTAAEIGARQNLRVLVTGGIVRPSSFEIVGALAESSFAALNIGIAFLGADGVSAEGGVTTHDEVEAAPTRRWWRAPSARSSSWTPPRSAASRWRGWSTWPRSTTSSPTTGRRWRTCARRAGRAPGPRRAAVVQRVVQRVGHRA